MRRPRKKIIKPRGDLGHLRLGRDVAFAPLEIPQTKEEIEKWIVTAAVRAAAEKGQALYDGQPRQNAEDDFDFTIETSHGREHLS